MIEEKESEHIASIKKEYAEGSASRREFLRFATLLGMSATSAYAFVGKVENLSFTPSQAKAAKMPKGGSLKIAMRCPKISDPATYSWIFDSVIMRQSIDYLTQTGQDNVTRGALFKSWKPSKDLKTWTFKIRNVNWHNGKKLTADDIIWNIKRILDPATGSSVLGLMGAYMLDDKQKKLWDANAIEKVDDSTIRLNLKIPQLTVPEHLFHYPFGILDPEDGGKYGVGANGTGAFKLVDFSLNRNAVFEASGQKYWGEGPHLKRLEFVDFGDNHTAVSRALESKQVNGIYIGQIEQYELYRAMPHVEVYRVASGATGVARVQVDRPEFKDPRVRKAMRLAIDVDAVRKVAYSIGTAAEHHHVSQEFADYFPLKPFKRDVEQAKKLLAEAGYPKGIDLEISAKPDPSWEIRAVESMTDQWKDAGIRVKINQLPSSKFWSVWDKVPFGFTEWAHRPLGSMLLNLAYRAGVPWNETHYNNSEFDKILDQVDATPSIKKRKKLLGKLETIMQEDGPIIQPVWRGLFMAYDKKVVGFVPHPTQYIFGNELAI